MLFPFVTINYILVGKKKIPSQTIRTFNLSTPYCLLKHCVLLRVLQIIAVAGSLNSYFSNKSLVETAIPTAPLSLAIILNYMP